MAKVIKKEEVPVEEVTAEPVETPLFLRDRFPAPESAPEGSIHEHAETHQRQRFTNGEWVAI